jgi:hemerythrin-like metal-binding protein
LKDIAKAIPLFKQCIDISSEDYPALIYLERCYEYQATGNHLGTGELQTELVWKEEQHTGVHEVDTAHRVLMGHINTLTAQVDRNACGDFAEIFPFLAQHAQHLFPLEEKLMRESDYPFAEGHAMEHRRFVENFSRLEKLVKSNTEDPRYLAFRTALLLLDWFASHATKADRHFARYMLNAKLA